MGMHSSTGWWYYFLVVCLIKIPVAILILARGAHGGPAKAGDDMASGRAVPGRAFCPDVRLSFLFQYAIQIGFRYLLPVYPLLFIWLGNYGSALRRMVSARIAVGFLVAWTIVGSLRTWPDYLAYFNEFAGGPGTDTIGWATRIWIGGRI